MNRLIAMLMTAFLAGCAANATDIDSIGQRPNNHRAIAQDYINKTFFDPYSVRDLEISEPFPGGTVINHQWESGQGWVICIKANAKNRFGAYIGRKETVIVWRNGKIIHDIQDNGWMFCQNARYS